MSLVKIGISAIKNIALKKPCAVKNSFKDVDISKLKELKKDIPVFDSSKADKFFEGDKIIFKDVDISKLKELKKDIPVFYSSKADKFFEGDKIRLEVDRAQRIAKEIRMLKQNPSLGVKPLESQLISNGTRILTDNFALKKRNLLKELSKVCDKNVLQRIEKAETPEKLAKILAQLDMEHIYQYTRIIGDNISAKALKDLYLGKMKKPNLPITMELEQYVYKLKAKRYSIVMARERAMHIPSKNPEVVKIENILKQKYGCNFVSLKDNEELAKNTLKAFEVASQNGVKIPKNVIASDFMYLSGENLLYGEGTILLNPLQQTLSKGYLSTVAEYHVPLHEILHCSHPELIGFSAKKIPEKYKLIKNQLSQYSASSETHETFVELYTKRLVNGLSKEEQELFDYLSKIR